MKKRLCFLFLFDGFADWEPALVIAGLTSYSDFEIKTFSVDGENVTSMGNLNIKPDFKLADIKSPDFDLLILPGGKKWEEGGNMEISEFTREAFQQGKTIAAICAATSFLAKLGILDLVKHTSNGLEYLKTQVPAYKAESTYVNEPCVVGNNVITANGAAMIEFAYCIFEHFNIFQKEDLKFWLNLYKSGGIISTGA